MTRDAKVLYRELVLDHGHRPRNEGLLPGATHEATLHNPLCGDRIVLRLRLGGDEILAAAFEARGCLIARASASLLTELVVGASAERSLSLADALEAIVGGDESPREVALEALRGVREFPSRRGCVTLAWEALRQALAREG